MRDLTSYLSERYTYHYFKKGIELRKDSSFEVSITLESGSKIGFSGNNLCKLTYILAQAKYLEVECDDFSILLRESQFTEYNL